MTPANQKNLYLTQRAKTIRADAIHQMKMEAIAAKGGKTLNEMRALSERLKASFMSKHRLTSEEEASIEREYDEGQ